MATLPVRLVSMLARFHSTFVPPPQRILFGLIPLVIALCFISIRAVGAEADGASADAESAWAEVEKLVAGHHPRPEWQGREPKPEELAAYKTKVRKATLDLARQAKAFATRFPTNENAGDARFFVALALCRAVAAGDSGSEDELKRFVAATLADFSIPEDHRVGVLLASGNLAVMKKLGMKEFTEPSSSSERDESTAASAREVIRQFPKNSRGYTLLLAIAERAKGERQKELAREILALDGASPPVKTMARHVLNGTKPYRVGKPIDLRFTALDGRDVDLAKLKGKVVLVDFWATDCGPCVGEMPNIKSAYDQFHTDGFEIIGISLDEKESALRKFIREKELPWPQYFDGQGWNKRFGLQYGIFSIPTMWLVDRRGNLCFTEARFNLAEQVKSLLQEKP